MALFDKIGIVGLGLIGGSLGLAIKEKKLAGEVIGVSRKVKTIKAAVKINAIDTGSLKLSALGGCDLVLLCTPVKTILAQLTTMAPYLKKGCLVTDTGSTKSEIVKTAGGKLPKTVDFIGAHPLAGSEKSGIYNADGGLFNGSLCILTPLKTSRAANMKKLSLFWETIGAKVKILDAGKHDEIISSTSHLAHIAAFSLVNSIPYGYLRFAASGLRDTTRIAASDPELWSGIFLTNKKQLLKSIGAFQKQLTEFTHAIRRQDEKKLFAEIKKAKLKRDKIPFTI